MHDNVVHQPRNVVVPVHFQHFGTETKAKLELEIARFPFSLHSVVFGLRFKFDFSTPMPRGSPLNISMGGDNKNHRSVPSVLT